MNRTSVFIGPEERAAIETIQKRYGVATESGAIRLALRVLAQAQRLDVVLPPRPKHARRSPKAPQSEQP